MIMNYADVTSEPTHPEKWVAVADICRCLHTTTTRAEITSALNRSAIYRLKKTWAKVSKQVSASGETPPAATRRRVWETRAKINITD